MKPIVMNERKKKWILTTSLVAVLGFSLSAPLKKEMGFADFASTAEVRVETIVRNGKKYQVKFFPNGEKVEAFVPYEMEGKSCETSTCLSGHTLDAKITDEVADLQVALDKVLKSVPVAKNEVADEPETREERREREQEEKEERARIALEKKEESDEKALENVLKRCEYKDEGKQHAACVAEKLVALLKERARGSKKRIDGKLVSNKIDADKLATFFATEMRQELLDIVVDPVDGDQTYAYKDLAKIIRDLQSGLRDYKKVREAVKEVAVDATKHYADKMKQERQAAQSKMDQSKLLQTQAQNLNSQAGSTTDMNQKIALMNSANQLQQQAFQLQQESMMLSAQGAMQQNWITTSLVPALSTSTQDGLNFSVQSGSLDQSFASQLMQMLNQQTLAITSALGNPLVTSSTVPPNTRVDSQRGSVAPGSTSFGPARQYNPSLRN